MMRFAVSLQAHRAMSRRRAAELPLNPIMPAQGSEGCNAVLPWFHAQEMCSAARPECRADVKIDRPRRQANGAAPKTWSSRPRCVPRGCPCGSMIRTGRNSLEGGQGHARAVSAGESLHIWQAMVAALRQLGLTSRNTEEADFRALSAGGRTTVSRKITAPLAGSVAGG